MTLLEKIDVDNSLFKTFKNGKYQIYIVKNARIYTDNNENFNIKNNNLKKTKIFQQV